MHPPDNFRNTFPPHHPPSQWNVDQPVSNQKPRHSWRGRFIVLAITSFIYLIACATPALEFNDPNDAVYYGFRVLVVGWLGALIGQFGWFANLFLLGSIFLLLFRRWIATFIAAALACALGLQTFMLFSQKVPVDEAATRHVELQSLKVGFYIWLMSITSIGIGALILRNRERARFIDLAN